jgi:hypothetical protein
MDSHQHFQSSKFSYLGPFELIQLAIGSKKVALFVTFLVVGVELIFIFLLNLGCSTI